MMRRIVGWIVVLLVFIGSYGLTVFWAFKDPAVLSILSSIGGIAVAIVVSALVGWFLSPLLDSHEGKEREARDERDDEADPEP